VQWRPTPRIRQVGIRSCCATANQQSTSNQQAVAAPHTSFEK
jgi:hypothetical protein